MYFMYFTDCISAQCIVRCALGLATLYLSGSSPRYLYPLSSTKHCTVLSHGENSLGRHKYSRTVELTAGAERNGRGGEEFQ